ncbi:MAG: DUF5606 domain-containing protein [Bacteroidales bacterium]|nr:DUF5606 domain-containing protein [Bacteroidales bacterium]
MDLTKILSIAGKPGLHMNVGQTKSGLIVESLADGKRFPAFAHEKMSSLAEISIFTTDEDVPLIDVLKNIYEKYDGKPAISPTSSGEQLKNFMKEVLPNYDADRVYTSDIKKLVSWYNQLAEKEMLDFAGEPAEEVKAEHSTETTSESETEETDSPSKADIA